MTPTINEYTIQTLRQERMREAEQWRIQHDALGASSVRSRVSDRSGLFQRFSVWFRSHSTRPEVRDVRRATAV